MNRDPFDTIVEPYETIAPLALASEQFFVLIDGVLNKFNSLFYLMIFIVGTNEAYSVSMPDMEMYLDFLHELSDMGAAMREIMADVLIDNNIYTTLLNSMFFLPLFSFSLSLSLSLSHFSLSFSLSRNHCSSWLVHGI